MKHQESLLDLKKKQLLDQLDAITNLNNYELPSTSSKLIENENSFQPDQNDIVGINKTFAMILIISINISKIAQLVNVVFVMNVQILI